MEMLPMQAGAADDEQDDDASRDVFGVPDVHGALPGEQTSNGTF